MTAKSSDGKVLFNEKKIYTPQSPAKGRGDKMVFGPHRKSGMLRDTSLQPGKTQVEDFEIKFPYTDAEKDGKNVRTVTDKAMDVTVALWHLPAGGEVEKLETNKGKYLFHESTKRVTVK